MTDSASGLLDVFPIDVARLVGDWAKPLPFRDVHAEIFAQFYRGQDVYNPLVLFFLGCVIVAGILGAMTVSSRIFFIQAGPAIIAAVLLLFGY